MPLPSGTEQLVVVCVNVPNVGAHGECDRLGIEPLCIGSTTNTPGVLEAGMLRDCDCLRFGAPRVQAADVRGELAAKVDVNFGIAFRASFASTRAGVAIRETLLLGPGEGCFLDEHALPLITIPGTTEPDDHGLERRVAARAPCQRGVAARQKHEMREVGARHAKRTLLLEAEPTPLPQLLAALRARGVAQNLEYDDVVRLRAG